MKFLTIFKKNIKNLFKGRINRKDYFVFTLLGIFFYFIIKTSFLAGQYFVDRYLLLFVLGLFSFAVLFLDLSVMIRRLHDLNHSALWLVVLFVLLFTPLFPLAFLFLLAIGILLLFKKGSNDINDFGSRNYNKSFFKRILNLE